MDEHGRRKKKKTGGLSLENLESIIPSVS